MKQIGRHRADSTPTTETVLTWKGLVREAFGPHTSDEDCDSVLWEHTGFPAFFTGDPVTCCRLQIARFAAECHLTGVVALTRERLGLPLFDEAVSS